MSNHADADANNEPGSLRELRKLVEDWNKRPGDERSYHLRLDITRQAESKPIPVKLELWGLAYHGKSVKILCHRATSRPSAPSKFNAYTEILAQGMVKSWRADNGEAITRPLEGETYVPCEADEGFYEWFP